MSLLLEANSQNDSVDALVEQLQCDVEAIEQKLKEIPKKPLQDIAQGNYRYM